MLSSEARSASYTNLEHGNSIFIKFKKGYRLFPVNGIKYKMEW